jgi:transcriptional regulator with XRE-family HTH domain
MTFEGDNEVSEANGVNGVDRRTTLRELLRTYRRGMGWTQEETAQRWNYSFETISAWERGKRTPSAQEVPRLANLLGIALEDLAACIHRGTIGDLEKSGIGRDAGTSGVQIPARHVPERWSAAYETWGELVHIYRNRSEFNAAFSYPKMIEGATSVVAVGISLNAIALTYSRDAIINSVVEGNTSYQLCFLDPESEACRQREREEGLQEGTIAELTRLNIRHMQLVRRQLAQRDHRFAKRLALSTFDLPARYNLYLVDDALMTAQSYGYGRGEDTPTLVLRRQTTNGLFEFYAAAARYTLEHAVPIPVPAAMSEHAPVTPVR